MVTSVVSMIGIARMSTGGASTLTRLRDRFVVWSSAAPPRKNPMNRLPLSPMKIDAGLKLKTRNDTSEPTNPAISVASATWPLT